MPLASVYPIESLVALNCSQVGLLAIIRILDAITLVLERGAIGALHVEVTAVLTLVFVRCHLVWLKVISCAIEIN